ncbi:MAG: sigma-70 family RNA polymerase sigma factor [Planctomycetaceae bacterium]|nr:sigma-70 family RNA polymerase sigma factor [Planctomycetaceae bacterium]
MKANEITHQDTPTSERPTNSIEVRLKVFTEHRGVVKHLARCHGWPSIFDDLVQVGDLALWDATKNFDTSRGVKLESYCWKLIVWRMLSEIKRQRKQTQPVQFAIREEARANGTLAEEDIASGERPIPDDIEEPDSVLRFRKALKELDGLNRQILEAYCQGKTEDEIAVLTSRSSTNVGVRKRKALVTVRNHMIRELWEHFYTDEQIAEELGIPEHHVNLVCYRLRVA